LLFGKKDYHLKNKKKGLVVLLKKYLLVSENITNFYKGRRHIKMKAFFMIWYKIKEAVSFTGDRFNFK